MRIPKLSLLGLCSIFLLSSLLILGINQPVLADDPTETPTPTATYQSLMELDGTPVPQDYSCSDYVLGYGEKNAIRSLDAVLLKLPAGL